VDSVKSLGQVKFNTVQLSREKVHEQGSTRDEKWFRELHPTVCAGNIYSQKNRKGL
jgi:hypothetical protein